MTLRSRAAAAMLACVFTACAAGASAQDNLHLPSFKGGWGGASKPPEWSPAVVPMPPATAIPASPARGGRGPVARHVLVLGGTRG